MADEVPAGPAAPISLDCRGLKCPLPVLKLEKRAEGLAPGTAIELRSDDPVARIDIPLWCRQHGHHCSPEPDGRGLRFQIVIG